MATSIRKRMDQSMANLTGEFPQLVRCERADIFRGLDILQERGGGGIRRA
ncbi:MAG: hypothetical protein Q7Q71_05615 [Verrucomicrobiota bacterium JB023]|nr:hypothetical protein [Verrucomicrobiota bacterium JB023]